MTERPANRDLIDIVYSLTAYQHEWKDAAWVTELLVNQRVTRLSFRDDRPTTRIAIPGGFELVMTTGFLNNLILVSFQMESPFDLGVRPASSGYVQADQYDGSTPMKQLVYYATVKTGLQIQANLTYVSSESGKPEELALPSFGLKTQSK